MKVEYGIQESKQSFNIKTMCPNYILEFRKTESQAFTFETFTSK